MCTLWRRILGAIVPVPKSNNNTYSTIPSAMQYEVESKKLDNAIKPATKTTKKEKEPEETTIAFGVPVNQPSIHNICTTMPQEGSNTYHQRYTNICLRKLDVAAIPRNRSMVIHGFRETGKSTLARDLLRNWNFTDRNQGVIVSCTEQFDGVFGTIAPTPVIYDKYTPQSLHTIVKQQQEKVKQGKGPESERFLVLDNCIADANSMRDPYMQCLFVNSRCLKISFIMTQSFPINMSTMMHTNIDYVFIMRNTSIRYRKYLYEYYGSAFPTFETFCQILNQCTEDHQCLVIHLGYSKSNKLEDQVFWYKAATGSSSSEKHLGKNIVDGDGDTGSH